ncbi:uncharacterized protein [Brachionichthys hirsutus]|uniref:uncharacterized protein n=1 Tax=Brachionichthys hirsutus TaxID=412623 RepID=UPI003604A451
MEALHVQPREEEEVTMKEQERECSGKRGEGGTEASPPAAGSTADGETDEDSEPEPSPANRRKVSFADAFGLNLVSVKEFDNAEVKEVDRAPEKETSRPSEEFHMTRLFTVPSSSEELDQRLQAQMVELESIGFLPGTSTIRGVVRVVNLCYSKAVYIRMSSDRWQSYFDLSAEYVPGSSDGKTDRFAFRHNLAPPFQEDGTRVELCLRYDASVGTFWANNKEMNYVLLCHQKGLAGEQGLETQEENGGCRSKRSCLKASRRGRPEEKPREAGNVSPVAGEAEALGEAEEANREMVDGARKQPRLCCKETARVGGIKSRPRAARLALVQDCLAQRSRHIPAAHSHDCNISQPLPTPWSYSGSSLHKRQKKPPSEGPRVLTYHEIPLLTLDWNVRKAHQWEAAETDDVWSGGAKRTPRKASEDNMEDSPSVKGKWEMFCNGTEDGKDKDASVFNVWQQFLNGSSSAGDSSVPESEWLQAATSVLPSNDKEAKTQNAERSQDRESQVASDPSAASHARISAPCHSLADILKTSLGNVALNAAGRRPGQPRVGSSRDASTAAWASSMGRSETNATTDTLQECGPEGLPLVSKGERTEHAGWESVREGIKEGAEGAGGGGPCVPNAAGCLATSSGERLNASAVGGISGGARLDQVLSSSREIQETGTKRSRTDDRLAFREAVREGAKIGEREEAKVNNCGGNKASAGEEVFRPQETDECETSERYADEKQRNEFRPIRNGDKPLWQDESDGKEAGPAQSQVAEPGQELSAEVESSPRVDYNKLSDGIKDPIRAEKPKATEKMESELEKMYVERFADDLVTAVWEEVFDLKALKSKRDLKTADAPAEVPDNTQESLPLEQSLGDACESGGGLEQTLEAKSNESSPREGGQSVLPAEQTHFLYGLPRDSSSSVQDLAAPTDQEPGLRDTRVKKRSVSCQETRRRTEERVIDASDGLTYKSLSPERLEESAWWSVLYILVHVTRLLICTLFVAGFFYVVYLFDFPAFLALYMFSLGWWFYKWKRYRGATGGLGRAIEREGKASIADWHP